MTYPRVGVALELVQYRSLCGLVRVVTKLYYICELEDGFGGDEGIFENPHTNEFCGKSIFATEYPGTCAHLQ